MNRLSGQVKQDALKILLINTRVRKVVCGQNKRYGFDSTSGIPNVFLLNISTASSKTQSFL